MCLDLVLPLGISRKVRLTSAGMEIGVRPIREDRGDDVEKGLCDGSCANAGTKKLGISFVDCASRRRHRRGCRNPAQVMTELSLTFRRSYRIPQCDNKVRWADRYMQFGMQVMIACPVTSCDLQTARQGALTEM